MDRVAVYCPAKGFIVEMVALFCWQTINKQQQKKTENH